MKKGVSLISRWGDALFPAGKFSRKRYFVLYTLIFIVMAFTVFGIFFYNGKSFIINSDGWNQHYKALVYYGRWLRSIVKSILFDHTLDISTFSFSLGYGSDIITTLHYYVIGDPLALLSVFVPTRFMAVFYNFLVLLRLYLAGMAFSLFCFYKSDQSKNKDGTESLPAAGALVGTFIYIFCGYTLFLSVRHPYFTNPMIYLPLVLIGIEKILDGKRPWLFVVMVFISAISNFYFFYMIAVLTVLYVIWQLIARFHWAERKTAVLKLVKIAGCALLGTFMSAVILLPVILLYFNDARSDAGYVYNSLYSLKEYTSYLGNYVAWNSSLSNSTNVNICLSVVVLLAAALLFLQKKNRDLKTAFLVLTVMTLIPAVNSAMNGFSYTSNRWVFGYSFLAAYIVVCEWRSLISLSGKERWKLWIFLLFYALLCTALSKSRSAAVYFALFMGVIMLAVVCMVKDHFGIRVGTVSLVLCVLVNISGNAAFLYSPLGENYADKFVDMAGINEKFEQTEAPAVNAVSEDDEEFFRYSGSSISPNSTTYSGLHSTQYYWSMINRNITDFRIESGLCDQSYSFNCRTLDHRTILSALANVKYFVKEDNLPYGYPSGEEASRYEVWENEFFLPFGYTYENYISRDDYEAMTPIEKQEAMLQGCVIESGETGKEAELNFTGTTLPFEVKAGDGLTFEDGRIDVTKAGAELTLTFDGTRNAETYLYLTGLSFTGYGPRELYTDKEWDELSESEKKEVEYQQRYYEEPSTLSLKVSSVNSEGDSTSATLNYYTPYYCWYWDRTDFMVNLGYDELGKISATLKFPYAGVYSFDSMEVLCQPMDNYEEQIAALGEDLMENVDFHENSAFATNNVTGTITLDTPKYLLMTIPYSDGWTATVDGEKQELLQANTMYMALYLDAGEHEIELTYNTPGLKAGLSVTGVSFILFAVLVILGEYRRRNKIKKEN